MNATKKRMMYSVNHSLSSIASHSIEAMETAQRPPPKRRLVPELDLDVLADQPERHDT
jgi:hypothetical protein